jgi:glycosyltransferase involved in cell wall biosynthesis
LDLPDRIKLPLRFHVRKFDAGMIDERFDQLILPTVLLEDSIDVYHNPTFSVPVVSTPARCISTVHDVVFRRHPELVEPRLRSYLDAATRRALCHAQAVITVSEYSKREIGELYPAGMERVVVIPNGLRPPTPVKNAYELLRASGLHETEYVLYVGSIEPKKNIELLLQGLRRLGRPQTKLVLAGSRGSGDYPLGRRIPELGLDGRVVALGYVSEDLLEALYSAARAFVYPSFYEGFGFPPLEAMARGVPTIVSNASSLPEVVGDGALLCDPNNPDELVRRLQDILSDPRLRTELAERGRKRAACFSWSECARRHLQLYEEIHANTASRV